MSYSGKAVLAVLAIFVTFAGAVSAAQDNSKLPYMNPTFTPEQRAADLVSRMTLEEKASQLVNQARAIPNLKVPAYDWWSEALHGVAVDGTTEFPEPIGLAATFDAPGIHEMAVDIGIEGRIVNAQAVRAGGSTIFHGLDFWSPNVNIFRDPRWGRGQETYGEDPFLTARMAVGFVTGMQGDDPKYYRVISTPKHFDVHSGPEPTRHFADVDVSRHDEVDTYNRLSAPPSLRARPDRSCVPITRSTESRPARISIYCRTCCAASGVSRDMWFPTATPSGTSSTGIITAPRRRSPPLFLLNVARTMNAPTSFRK